jgi:hypothetical protein
LGAIFVQLLIGYPIFAGESDIEQIGKIVNRLGKPSNQVEKEVIFQIKCFIQSSHNALII